jgi:hypothetical protein
MNRASITARTAVGIAVLAAATACNRNAAGPELQTSTGVQPKQEAITVNGCMREGLAENTFVLTADNNGSTTTPTSTYQLDATGHGVALADYVGQQVEVSGMLRSDQEVDSSGVTAVEKSAKGTSGTPTVQTKSELDVKQMTVSAVKPLGQKCAAAPPPAPENQPTRRIK